ncbi:MAG: hypothetical protein AW07_01681 [Candidatus Accumulibacter sp. SK-11]|nr:MAG: hypothetical protein AW07_01681 [Candidatus Accumulibacter sp. SK-11]
MDARTDAAVPVVVAHDDAGHHLGVLAVGTSDGTILAVAAEVEDRADLALQLQRLGDQLFGARVVVDGGQHREGLLARE